MKKAASDTATRTKIEPDLRNRLGALTEGGKLLVSKMSADQKARCGTTGFRALGGGQELQDVGDVLKAVEREDPGGAVPRKVCNKTVRTSAPYFPR